MGASREDDLAGVSFALDGARLFRRALARDQARGLADRLSQGLDGRPGRRIRVDPTTEALLSSDGPVGAVAAGLIGAKARPVRALLFDKTKAANWIVAWHQDRTIAVRARIEVPGFGPWSVKDGVAHVAPPIEILQAMVTLRLHLDRCDDDNAPLTVALGTHRLGRIPADEAAAVAQRRPHLCCPAEAGDVWAYATPILHTSARSVSDRRRRVLQVDYAAVDLPGGLEWLGVSGDATDA